MLIIKYTYAKYKQSWLFANCELRNTLIDYSRPFGITLLWIKNFAVFIIYGPDDPANWITSWMIVLFFKVLSSINQWYICRKINKIIIKFDPKKLSYLNVRNFVNKH